MRESMDLVVHHDWSSFPNFDFTSAMFSPVDDICPNDGHDIDKACDSIPNCTDNPKLYPENDNICQNDGHDIDKACCSIPNFNDNHEVDPEMMINHADMSCEADQHIVLENINTT